MVWGLVRVSVFTTAFFIGMALTDSGGGSASAKTTTGPQLDESAGATLVVACNDGNVIVRQLDRRGAVQLDCERSRMVVVRDHYQSSEKNPEFPPLRNQLHLLVAR